MAIKLTNALVALTNTNRTQVYRAPADVSAAVVFGGTVTNVSQDKRVAFLTLEIRSGSAYRSISKDTAIPYGISPVLPKIVLKPGEYLYATSSTGNALELVASILEQ